MRFITSLFKSKEKNMNRKLEKTFEEFSYLKFLQNKTKNNDGYYLKDYWDMKNSELEYIHNYIQFMFPLYEPSSVKPYIPVLNKDEVQKILTNKGLYHDIKENIKKSLTIMLDFYGLKYEKDKIEKYDNFIERKKNWITPRNHNYLRITRILKCLMIFEMRDEAIAFYRMLLELKGEYPKEIDDISVDYWVEAVGNLII